ncbi:hypothetical protein [Kineococcus gypseus]|uniref:hypothetical protein n=1 Tax=Kineococcus gypseus TaxID=1637102 RepID=UPI003D7EA3C8
MDVTQKARDAVVSAVGAAARKLPGRGPGAPAQQTLTVARPAGDVLAAWGDAQVVSRLLGEAGRAEADGARWTFTPAAGGPVDAELVPTGEGLEFRRPGGGDVLLRVSTRPAPADLGTEVTCEVAPELSAGLGAVPFTLLYRLRALLLTGEIPTLGPQPAAREEER